MSTKRVPEEKVRQALSSPTVVIQMVFDDDGQVNPHATLANAMAKMWEQLRPAGKTRNIVFTC